MKLLNRKKGQSGSVLVVTLFIASLFGIFLYAYLNIVSGQRAMVARSQAWNASLAMAEAGAEEALAHLNPGAPRRRINRASNGWALANGYYVLPKRKLDEGEYVVMFSDINFPKIYSTGYVAVPSLKAGVLQRSIELCTTNAPLFTAAMAARYNIDLKGNGVMTDSFNSMNPAFSTNGTYWPAYASTNGDVASIGGLVNVGNADINGAVLLGPTAANTIGSQGSILNGVNNDFNVEFADVVLPENTSSWVAATAPGTPMVIDGIQYDYVFDTGTSINNYTIDNLRGSVYVGTNTTVTLLLTGDATVTTIRIAGLGAAAGNLSVYMTGSTFTLSGNSTIDTGNALNMSYYGAPSNTQIRFMGNAGFIGTIYAPEADFSLGGGGSSTYDFIGASTTRSVQMNGHFNFHFDENLLREGPRGPFVAASWREL